MPLHQAFVELRDKRRLSVFTPLLLEQSWTPFTAAALWTGTGSVLELLGGGTALLPTRTDQVT